MLKLLQYPGKWGLPSLSPFCSKVYYFLKWQNLPFELVTVNNPNQGPKGKFPVLVDNEVTVADSEHIINYLIKKYCPSLKTIATDELAYVRMCEEHLYFVMLYSRWIDPDGFAVTKKEFQKFFPPIIHLIAIPMIARSLKKQGIAQGLARHTKDEIYQKGINDLVALEQHLEQRLTQGLELTVADMTYYAFLLTFSKTPIDNKIQEKILNSDVLQHYLQQVSAIQKHWS